MSRKGGKVRESEEWAKRAGKEMGRRNGPEMQEKRAGGTDRIGKTDCE